MKPFTKLLLLALTIIILASLSVTTVMAAPYPEDKTFFDVYGGSVVNDENDGFWMDSEDDIAQTFEDGEIIRSGRAYYSYIRDNVSMFNIDFDDTKTPYFSDEEDNRYISYTKDTYFMIDQYIADSYMIQMDIKLIGAEADKFVGIVFDVDENADGKGPQGKEKVCVATNSESDKYAAKIGFCVAFNVADDSKDEIVIYVVDKDATVKAQYVHTLANGALESWNKITVIDDISGTVKFYCNTNQLIATMKLSEIKDDFFTKAVIYNAAGEEVASTSNAYINTYANFNLASLNPGIMGIDNWAVVPYEFSADVDDPINTTPEPTATPAPTTVPTQAPATKAPEATQATTADNKNEKSGGCGSSMAIAQIMMILGATVIIKKRK